MASIIDNVSESLNTTLDSGSKVSTPSIPTPLLYGADSSHNGMDYQRLANDIFTELGKLEPKITIKSTLPNGEKSLMEQVIVVCCKCFINEIMKNAKVEIGVAPGSSIIAVGSNSGGPVICNGYNTDFIKGNGIIS